MRLALLTLLAVALVAAVETEHFIVNGNGASELATYLEEAYSFYLSKGLSPAPPCGGSKYLVEVGSSNGGDTAYGSVGGVVCIEKLRFGVVQRLLAFHEVGHVFQLKYVTESSRYEWYIEALPEAMASVGSGDYYWVSQYFAKRLYSKNPLDAEHGDWYIYGAAFVWHLKNRSSWEDVVRASVQREGAMRLYLEFLLGVVKGMYMDKYYAPEFEEIDASSGYVQSNVSLDGYSAAYFKIAVPPNSTVKIIVTHPNVVSNIVLGKEFKVYNNTLLLALVNNSTKPVSSSLEIYVTKFSARLLHGVYSSGFFNLTLSAEYSGEGVNGVVDINGSSVVFTNGVGVYSFRGSLRYYVISLEYRGHRQLIHLNFTQLKITARPNVLYLGPGGHGFLNITVWNPNSISVKCTLNAKTRGISIHPLEVLVFSNSTSSYAVGFNVTGDVADPIEVFCDASKTVVQVNRIAYSLDYDLDVWEGNLSVITGSEQRTYVVKSLPGYVNVTLENYTAARIFIPAPSLNLTLSRPRLEVGYVVYTLNISVVGPPWARFKGTVEVNGVRRGFYRGGVFTTEIRVSPGSESLISVAVGRLKRDVPLRVPTLKIDINPIVARVNGSIVDILAKVVTNIDTNYDISLDFTGPGLVNVVRSSREFIIIRLMYNDTLLIRYSALGEKGSVYIRIPKPEISTRLIRGVVSPTEFSGFFNITVRVCNPSVDVYYIVKINNSIVTLNVTKGGCAFNSTTMQVKTLYNSTVKFNFVNPYGAVTTRINVPPPAVGVELLRWQITDRREVATLLLRVAPQNYTYVIFGKEVTSHSEFETTVEARDGVAEVNYGFGVVRVKRPQLTISVKPVSVETNTSYTLYITLKVPQDLYVNATLGTSLNNSRYINIGPGTWNFTFVNPGIRSPGVYNVSIFLGPYVNYTTLLVYRVNVTISAPSLAPVGAPVNVTVIGHVYPSTDVSVLLNISGCGVYNRVVRLNQTIQYRSARPCTAVFTAYTNTTKASASVRWASLTVGVNYTRLGTIRGLPVFPPRGFSAYALLGGVQVPARVEVVGDFDRLGRVSYNITVEYMGVVNRSVFVGYAAPPGSYTAANKTLGLLPPEARPYFQYLMERAAATGDWDLVDQISRLYTGAPTPMALLARYLVERDLAAGRGPNVAAAEALRQIEPLVLGIAGGLFLAFVRRFV
jgi:hypothetical protein